MKLDGKWRASELTDTLLASAPDPELDDSNWQTVNVPGQWASDPHFRSHKGPVVYRRSFSSATLEPTLRSWLHLDGVVGDAEVWLDGKYLGESNEYFKSSRFDISKFVSLDDLDPGAPKPAEQHLIAVEVTDATKSPDKAKRTLTGALHGSHLSAPGSPAGIWRSVRIQQTGPVAILHSRLICTHASSAAAELSFRLVLDAAEAGRITIDTSIVGPAGDRAGGGLQTFTVASGENQIEWTHSVANPELWWPAELGEQALYDVGLTIRTGTTQQADGTQPARSKPGNGAGEHSEVSDRTSWRTGLRTVEVDKFVWKINGQRIFIKGITHGPSDPLQAEHAATQLAADVTTTLAAGLNLIRVYGHVSYPELYSRADVEGLLIWQDLPLVGTYAASARKPAEALARAATDVLGHHPSVTVWCAHDEPNGAPLPEPKGSLDPLATLGKHLGRHLLPSWSRSILDPLIRRQLRHSDPSRPVITRSGSLPGLADHDRSDPHLWLGWHSGRASDLAKVLKRWPRIGSFLGGFGTQSVELKDWDLNEPDWPGAQQGAFQRYMPRRAYADGPTWAQASRLYQADILRQHIETIRRLKYKPAGGYCVTSLVDAEPSGGFGILDYQRQPKPAYEATVDASRAVVVIADRPPPVVTPGKQISLQVHVVNDLRQVLDDVTVRAKATLGEWSWTKNWRGSIPADSCSFVGLINFAVPAIHGQLIIDIDLDQTEQVATNRYQSAVIPTAEGELVSQDDN